MTLKKIFNIIVWQKLIWATQTINVWLLFGMVDEGVSSRSFRLKDHAYMGWFWSRMERFVNAIFRNKNHCRNAYLVESAKVAAWERHV